MRSLSSLAAITVALTVSASFSALAQAPLGPAEPRELQAELEALEQGQQEILRRIEAMRARLQPRPARRLRPRPPGPRCGTGCSTSAPIRSAGRATPG